MKGRLAPGVWTVVAVIRACACKSHEVVKAAALEYLIAGLGLTESKYT